MAQATASGLVQPDVEPRDSRDVGRLGRRRSLTRPWGLASPIDRMLECARLSVPPRFRWLAAASNSAAQPVLVFLGSTLLLAAALPVLVDHHQATTGDGGFYVRM